MGVVKSSADVAATEKDCWNKCDYPSECRWGKKIGIHTPVQQEFPVLEVETAPTHTQEGVLKAENCRETKAERMDLWGVLMASATRRRKIAGGSPLGGVAEENEEAVERDGDGDMVMKDTEIRSMSLPISPSVPEAAGSSTVAVAVDMFKDMMKRNTTRRARGLALGAHDRGRMDAVTMLGGSLSVGEEQGQMLASDALLVGGFPELERVRSRDSGYHYTVDVV
jgi:hypothetical protein